MFRSYYYNYWLGYLTHIIATKCLQKAKQRCVGCQNKKTSALLHPHMQMSLLDKMICYLDETRAEVIQNISEYFDKFRERIGVSEDENLFCSSGQTFLLTATPNSLFYGRYIDEEIDNAMFPTSDSVASSSVENSKPEKARRKRTTPTVATVTDSCKQRKKKVDDCYPFDDIEYTTL